jgi:hypothetical protein
LRSRKKQFRGFGVLTLLRSSLRTAVLAIVLHMAVMRGGLARHPVCQPHFQLPKSLNSSNWLRSSPRLSRAMMAQRKSYRIQLLYVPDCPLVESARSTLKKSLTQTHVDAVVEELVGDYSSPTILIDGFDVTGRPREPANQASCRLDLPTQEQILVALRGVSVLAVLSCEGALMGRLQASAFRLLLQTVKPVSVDHLVTRIGASAGITSGVKVLDRSGHIRLDPDGCIVGALGLSVRPTMHELSIDGSRLWAWCAFDAIGIFGSLRASGSAQSTDPYSGENIALEFADGIPQNREYVVVMPDVQSNSAICEDWCSKVNFFTSVQSAEEWGQVNGVAGSLVSVGNLVPIAVEVWSRLLARD